MAKERRIVLRCSDVEKEDLESQAKEEDRTLSNWILHKLVRKPSSNSPGRGGRKVVRLAD